MFRHNIASVMGTYLWENYAEIASDTLEFWILSFSYSATIKRKGSPSLAIFISLLAEEDSHQVSLCFHFLSHPPREILRGFLEADTVRSVMLLTYEPDVGTNLNLPVAYRSCSSGIGTGCWRWLLDTRRSLHQSATLMHLIFVS
jgi:hypothetical protein